MFYPNKNREVQDKQIAGKVVSSCNFEVTSRIIFWYVSLSTLVVSQI